MNTLKNMLIGLFVLVAFAIAILICTLVGGFIWAIVGSIGWLAGGFLGALVKAFIYGGLFVCCLIVIGAVAKMF